MRILPAIDLLNGKCVRLTQGDYNRVTTYGDDPAEMARYWESLGAEGLHLVDLDGAKAGTPVNRDAIRDIVDAVGIPTEIGGGIRSVQTAQEYLDLGITQVIFGTAAIENPDLVLSAADLFPDRVLVGLDVKNGKPAVKGWLETADLDPVELANRFAAMGAAGVIYTDISRDGALLGANVEGLRDFASKVELPVTASGGVTSVADVRAIAALGSLGVTGVIIGKALYDGAIRLEDAVAAAAEVEQL